MHVCWRHNPWSQDNCIACVVNLSPTTTHFILNTLRSPTQMYFSCNTLFKTQSIELSPEGPLHANHACSFTFRPVGQNIPDFAFHYRKPKWIFLLQPATVRNCVQSKHHRTNPAILGWSLSQSITQVKGGLTIPAFPNPKDCVKPEKLLKIVGA